MRVGKSVAKATNASRSVGKDSMYEWAIVPATRSPNRRAASTLEVAVNPTIAVARATAIAASMPCVRRNEKSTSSRPSAASRHRAAFEAMVVWNVMVQQVGLDELGDRDRRRELEDRLVRQDDAALGHGPDVALEPQVAEGGERLVLEPEVLAEVRELVLLEPEVLEERQAGLEAGRDQEPAGRR